MFVHVVNFAGESLDVDGMSRENPCILSGLQSDFRNSCIPNQLLIFCDDIVLHLLEKRIRAMLWRVAKSPFSTVMSM